MLNAGQDKGGISVKSSPKDFVTGCDLAIQDMLQAELKRLMPEAEFIGEENHLTNSRNDGYRFIVDPIDGTTNFIWDYKHSAVSIALANREVIVTGLVYNPFLDELFWAEIGNGAFMNGERIMASQRRLNEGLVIFGTSPYDRNRAAETFALAQHLYENAMDVRRTGSAALDLCYIACGRCDLYYEMMLSPWDYAAASLIVNEAGGIVSTLKKERLQYNSKTSVIAGNPLAYEEFWKTCPPFLDNPTEGII